MWRIVSKTSGNGKTLFTVQNKGSGEIQILEESDLLQKIQNNFSVENAKISMSGKILITQAGVNQVRPITTAQPQAPKIKYPRTLELEKLTAQEKHNYYYDVIGREDKAISDYSVDELDCFLEAMWGLEMSDRGSSTVDLLLERNIFYFPSISRVLKEVIARGYLTEAECKQYLVGCGDNGRYCNKYTFTQWILNHKKE